MLLPTLGRVVARPASGYLGPGLVARGSLTGQGELMIDGRLEGDIAVDGDVSVGQSGAVLGAVVADTVTVAGQVRGDIRARVSVAVRAGGRVDGDVKASRVSIDDGGVLDGGVDMNIELSRELAMPEPR